MFTSGLVSSSVSTGQLSDENELRLRGLGSDSLSTSPVSAVSDSMEMKLLGRLVDGKDLVESERKKPIRR